MWSWLVVHTGVDMALLSSEMCNLLIVSELLVMWVADLMQVNLWVLHTCVRVVS